MRIFIPELSTKLKVMKDFVFETNEYEMYELGQKTPGFTVLSDNYSKHDNYLRDCNNALNRWRRSKLDADYVEVLRIKEEGSENSSLKILVKIDSGMILNVERVYIRKGASDYSSLTFRAMQYKNEKLNNVRFYVALKYVNTMDVEVL